MPCSKAVLFIGFVQMNIHVALSRGEGVRSAPHAAHARNTQATGPAVNASRSDKAWALTAGGRRVGFCAGHGRSEQSGPVMRAYQPLLRQGGRLFLQQSHLRRPKNNLQIRPNR